MTFFSQFIKKAFLFPNIHTSFFYEKNLFPQLGPIKKWYQVCNTINSIMKATGKDESILGRPVRYNIQHIHLILYYVVFQCCYACFFFVQWPLIGSRIMVVVNATCTLIFWNVHLKCIVFTQLCTRWAVHCVICIVSMSSAHSKTRPVQCAMHFANMHFCQWYWLLLLFLLLFVHRFCDTFLHAHATFIHNISPCVWTWLFLSW